jgi:hypothetical protein
MSHADRTKKGLYRKASRVEADGSAAAGSRRVHPAIGVQAEPRSGREGHRSVGAVTLDTGALVALERYRPSMMTVLEAAKARNVSVTAPANAVAEWWRGRTDRRDFIRRTCIIRDVDEEIAKLAGEALAWLGRRHADIDDRVTIDATVIATAALYGPILYTGDFEHMQHFADFFPAVRLLGLSSRA